MRRHLVIAGFLVLQTVGAHASTLAISVTDKSGKPAASAVISLEADGPPIASHLPQGSIIDQRHEMFLPLDVVVRTGGRVVFTNNDTTKHQVYSFSPIKQFQFVISQGEVSQPVEFPKAGIAAIGCNIHDQMIAYVFVGDMPYASVTDDQGRAEIGDVKPGHYRVAVWHPQMGPQFAPTNATLDIADKRVEFNYVLPFTVETPRAMKHMHMDY